MLTGKTDRSPASEPTDLPRDELPPMSNRVPKGFRLAGVHCGIKQDPEHEDLTLVVADGPLVAAGVYTQNVVFSAPVSLNRSRTPSDNIRAVVVNSGNANACPGQRGLKDAREMARSAAAACGADAEQALVMSTGIIGQLLPMDEITAGIQAAAQRLGSDESSLESAARGMMTTDTVRKIAGRELAIAGGEILITGLAKGAAMIGPNMATMLCVVLTDAALHVDDAQEMLTAAVDDSFNCISVEGHMSTSDTVLLLASGSAVGQPLAGDDLRKIRVALAGVCTDLAQAIVVDGEGATHFVTVEVTGCRSRDDARRIAKTIAESALVKTAIAGSDPNWGRIVSAAGYAGVPFAPDGVELTLNGRLLYKQGAQVQFDAAEVSASIRDHRDTHILLRLAEGNARVRFWTTDLTTEYVRLNADYHT